MPHFIRPKLVGFDSAAEIFAVFECTEPDNAECRMVCKEGCEEHPKIDVFGNEVECEMSAIGYCFKVESLTGDSHVWRELHWNSGPDTILREGEVELEWDGDGYRWKYPEESYDWGVTSNKMLEESNGTAIQIMSSRIAALAEVANVNHANNNEQIFMVKRVKAGLWERD